MPGLSGKSRWGMPAHYLLQGLQSLGADLRRAALALRSGFMNALGRLFPATVKCLPLLQQAQAGESGLSCMAMLAIYHRCPVNLPALRRHLVLSSQELNLAQLVRAAGKMAMSCRPRRINPARLSELRAPVILQWEQGRYVVLKRAQGSQLTLHDPATGVVTVSEAEAQRAFTGIIIECEPYRSFGRNVESWVR